MDTPYRILWDLRRYMITKKPWSQGISITYSRRSEAASTWHKHGLRHSVTGSPVGILMLEMRVSSGRTGTCGIPFPSCHLGAYRARSGAILVKVCGWVSGIRKGTHAHFLPRGP